ncbi:MAG TPA: hypothetical protein VHZ76_08190 [Gammaproteobacteria bacterium]|jgi:metal-responsive CopG/Arc/MetJ family transcriptional regulator|nr:hypothetical protein [Gammaproteobacteria bacterium]
MKRLSISFDDKTYGKLEEKVQGRGIKSVAQYVRELVDLGLRIEEARSNNEGNQEENKIEKLLHEIKNLLKNTLNWSLETRFLARFLVEAQHQLNDEKRADILAKCKESSQQYVSGLYGEEAK